MEELNPKIKTLWAFSGLLFTGIPAVIALFLWKNPLSYGLLLVPVVGVYFQLKRYSNFRYQLKDNQVRLKKGVIYRAESVVPFVRIQHVSTRQGPLERLLGLSTLQIYTAGSRSAEIRVPGLSKTRAEELREQLKDRAIESEEGLDAV